MAEFYWIILLISLIFELIEAKDKSVNVSKSISCVSFMENDHTSLEYEDKADSEESHESNRNTLYLTYTSTNLTSVNDYLRICPPDYTYCFALWRQTVSGNQMEKQGCWKQSTDGNAICNHTDCVSSAPISRTNSLYYCCCAGHNCNQIVSINKIKEIIHEQTQLENYLPTNNSSNIEDNKIRNWPELYSFLINIFLWIFVIGITIFMFYTYCQRIAEKRRCIETTSNLDYNSKIQNVNNINLISILGNGKYGTVLKGVLHGQEVAVKIFSESYYQYFINERNIYSLPLMDSPALLNYFGYDQHQTLEGKIEYHLILSLAPLGCLQDWLVNHTLSFEIFCGMVTSITCGLSHLHTAIKHGEKYKPCIAHRDFNTRNILVKEDCTCCISDFGFALKVFGSRYEYKGEIAEAEYKSINEVGTLRYMAPELLEGAVNLRDCETSLKQIDVYALGLVLWEVATRCRAFYPALQIIPSYKAPYENEVGTKPTFDQMQTLVVRHRSRPLFPQGWSGGLAAKLVRDTCEDCWDHDAEARLTSLCAEERMHEVCNAGSHYQQLAVKSPLVNSNNFNVKHQQIDNNVLNILKNSPSNITSTASSEIIPETNAITPIHQLSAISKPYNEARIQLQHQLQPYQGSNSYIERNFSYPGNNNVLPNLIQSNKRHSSQTILNQSDKEYVFSCLDDNISMKEIVAEHNITNKCSEQLISLQEHANVRQGLSKQNNADRKLKKWRSIKSLIQKKLFYKSSLNSYDEIDVFGQMNGGGRSGTKMTLMDNRTMATSKNLETVEVPTENSVIISFTNTEGSHNDGQKQSTSPALALALPLRHKNSHLIEQQQQQYCSHLKVLDLNTNNIKENKSCHRLSTLPAESTAHIVPRVLSSTYIIPHLVEEDKNSNLNVINKKSYSTTSATTSLLQKTSKSENKKFDKVAELKVLPTAESKKCMKQHIKVRRQQYQQTSDHQHLLYPQQDQQFYNEATHLQRQSSLEVFRDVFYARRSCENLRNSSERVKTPVDIPRAVNKLRASKTLSLYDDRMMDSSTLNIL